MDPKTGYRGQKAKNCPRNEKLRVGEILETLSKQGQNLAFWPRLGLRDNTQAGRGGLKDRRELE